ncbi:hypothetical protein BDBG_03692 [Blastomyces gilchristii SLH14081]|uniref:Uncharacterized protein n=1 Tax=Blastomyces gilchristii (strain SLH14081) TaxID=559298 RepID=A0A179UKW3_BLAGS|nr:uncharacterized protein BDBG_03692 [Blastomyces gilchristii SLH14081]OAT07651.1 hypothetical protein BDBG_03692 [Blastomyces gilchristii SLH14081]
MDFSAAYDPTIFGNVSSLETAAENFRNLNGVSIVQTTLKSLILQHEVADSFGVALVHRHFDLDNGTVLVEKDMVLSPWACDSSWDKFGGKIAPISWLCKGDKTFPYEFGFFSYRQAMPMKLEEHSAFVQAYFDAVKQHGLEEYIGLRRLSGREPEEMLECTEGKVNINFPISEIPPEFVENGTQTMWFFDGQPPYRMYRCSCINTGSKDNPNHNHIDRN